MIVPSLVWYTFGAYNVVIIITYIRRGLRVVVPISWAMRRPQFVELQQSSSTFFLWRFDTEKGASIKPPRSSTTPP